MIRYWSPHSMPMDEQIHTHSRLVGGGGIGRQWLLPLLLPSLSSLQLWLHGHNCGACQAKVKQIVTAEHRRASKRGDHSAKSSSSAAASLEGGADCRRPLFSLLHRHKLMITDDCRQKERERETDFFFFFFENGSAEAGARLSCTLDVDGDDREASLAFSAVPMSRRYALGARRTLDGD